MFDVVETRLAAALANSGTVLIGYPTNRDDGDYAGGYDHRMYALGAEFKATEGKISISAGATGITVTYNGSTTIPAGTEVRFQFDRVGKDHTRPVRLADTNKMAGMELVIVNLGAPLAIDVDAVCAAQNRTGAGPLVINGSGTISNGVFINDCPRNLIADSGGADTAVLTITGTDWAGNVMVEDITLNGTTAVAGKKAFKTVTSVTSSATISNGAFLGTGDVLGLPVFLGQKGWVLKEMEDGAAATAGTLVVGDSSVATATTGDVRGTYDPNSACDGAKDFQLIMAVPDPSYIGVPQFAG